MFLRSIIFLFLFFRFITAFAQEDPIVEKNAGDAFNKVQQDLFTSHLSPYYWAAFVYIRD